MGVQVMTVKREITNEKRKVIWDKVKVSRIIIKNYWDAHGDTITDSYEEFKNAEVTISDHSWKEFGRTWKTREVAINGKIYEGEITSIHGDQKLLEITACIGAG